MEEKITNRDLITRTPVVQRTMGSQHLLVSRKCNVAVCYVRWIFCCCFKLHWSLFSIHFRYRLPYQANNMYFFQVYVTYNASSCDIKYIFEVKLTFDMLTVRGQQHSFSTHERIILWKYQSLWDRKIFGTDGDANPQPLDSCRMLQCRV